MGQQPLVSVIIPAYRTASCIRETLDSVYAQTYPNFEIVLVNDGSPDTEELERAIDGYDERLIYIRQENQGPSGARNTGIRAAHGKYIACLDSDDIYLPEHLARLVSHLEAKGLDLLYSDSYFTKNGARVCRSFEWQPQSPPVTFEKLLTVDCGVTTSAMMASRQAMIDAGLFDERFLRCEDFDLWLRMSARGAKMGFVPEVGIEHRLLPDGLAADLYELKLARAQIYRKTLATLPLSPQQKRLIEELIALTEGLSEIDLLKRHLQAGRYPEARASARNAARLLRDSRTRILAFIVQIVPWAARRYLRLREAWQRNRKQKPRFVTNGQIRTRMIQLRSKVELQSSAEMKQP